MSYEKPTVNAVDLAILAVEHGEHFDIMCFADPERAFIAFVAIAEHLLTLPGLQHSPRALIEEFLAGLARRAAEGERLMKEMGVHLRGESDVRTALRDFMAAHSRTKWCKRCGEEMPLAQRTCHRCGRPVHRAGKDGDA